ncbi:MAG: GNAT family N-acetyltransferase [Phycisphaerae bacterium]|nr:GNAT family N-acetyltransferase [Phycisphaerae bacterium]
MPLPVLPSSSSLSSEALLRLFHQTELEWQRHLGDETVLDNSIALMTKQGIALSVTPPDSDQWPMMLRNIRQFFLAHGRLSPSLQLNPSIDPSCAHQFEAFLQSQGWQARRCDVFHLIRRRNIAPSKEIRLIPARASFRHVELLDEISPPKLLPHLDDPHVDAWIAMDGRNVIGAMAVLAVGETGRIAHLFVTPDRRRQGIGGRLLDRALDIAARSLMKHVFIAVDEDESATRALATSVGFELIGNLTTWAAPPIDTASSSPP